MRRCITMLRVLRLFERRVLIKKLECRTVFHLPSMREALINVDLGFDVHPHYLILIAIELSGNRLSFIST